MDGDGWRARLLVASPTMTDPNFARSVVLLLAHSVEGALGVVLNRPSPADLANHLPRWGELAATPAVVFFGGPVARGSAIGLGRAGGADAGAEWASVLDQIGTVDLGVDPDGTGIDAVRVFSG
ncbi:MAG: YqgE/AlgH family protein, partial [Acidimicrobiales bacterium]